MTTATAKKKTTSSPKPAPKTGTVIPMPAKKMSLTDIAARIQPGPKSKYEFKMMDDAMDAGVSTAADDARIAASYETPEAQAAIEAEEGKPADDGLTLPATLRVNEADRKAAREKADAEARHASEAERAEKKAATTKAAAEKKTPGAKKRASKKSGGGSEGPSKLSIVAGLLTRKTGCTTREILNAIQWPAVSVPAMAKAAKLTLRKEKKAGHPTRYFGKPA